jgi:hypothetical protein
MSWPVYVASPRKRARRTKAAMAEYRQMAFAQRIQPASIRAKAEEAERSTLGEFMDTWKATVGGAA